MEQWLLVGTVCFVGVAWGAIEPSAGTNWPEESYGWKVWGREGGRCDVERVEIDAMTVEKFTAEFALDRPVLLVGLGPERNRLFRESCARETILREWGDSNITLSTANTRSYEKRRSTLANYIAEVVDGPPAPPGTPGSDTWYWFGDNDHKAWSSFFDAYALPPFADPATVALSFGIGAPQSGVSFHIHGRVFAETIIGRKRWLLSPPHAKPIFDGEVATADWISSSLDANGGPTSPDLDHDVLLDCTVHETEILYIPAEWWHATLNLDQTVFISSFIDDHAPSDAKLDLRW